MWSLPRGGVASALLLLLGFHTLHFRVQLCYLHNKKKSFVTTPLATPTPVWGFPCLVSTFCQGAIPQLNLFSLLQEHLLLVCQLQTPLCVCAHGNEA